MDGSWRSRIPSNRNLGESSDMVWIGDVLPSGYEHAYAYGRGLSDTMLLSKPAIPWLVSLIRSEDQSRL